MSEKIVLPPFEKESPLCVWSQITPALCMTRSWNFTWIIVNIFLHTPQNFTLLLPGIFEKWAKTFALSRLKLVKNRRKWANPLIRNCKWCNALTPKCMKIPHMWTFFFKRRKYIIYSTPTCFSLELCHRHNDAPTTKFFLSSLAQDRHLGCCCFAENKWNPPFIEKSVWERDHLLCLLMIDDEALPCCSECRMNWAIEIDENWESMKRPWSWYCCWVVALTIRTPDLIPYFVASTFPLLVLGITWALSFLSEAHSHTTTIQVFSFVLKAWHSFVVAFSLKNVWKMTNWV